MQMQGDLCCDKTKYTHRDHYRGLRKGVNEYYLHSVSSISISSIFFPITSAAYLAEQRA